MNYRPIPFRGPMVRAILDGRKSQTRWVLKTQPLPDYTEIGVDYFERGITATYRAYPGQGSARWGLCDFPYGVPGDRLWVRETWRPRNDPALYTCIQYRADMACVKPTQLDYNQGYWCESAAGEENEETRWRPSIHMPRWAARIFLEIESVRVERVQDISGPDTCAEGVQFRGLNSGPSPKGNLYADNIRAFATLWDSLNAARGLGWDANPWVWAIGFRSLGGSPCES